MRILTISNYFPEHVGGIEFVAANLVRCWRKRHRVRWAAGDVHARPHACEPDDLALPVWNVTEERLGFPYPIPLGKAASEILREVQEADVVHLHDCLYMANWIAFVAARLSGKPVVITQHAALAAYPESYKRALQWLAYRTAGRLLLTNAAQVAFIGARVKSWFESWIRFHTPALLIPNGIDRATFPPAARGEREKCRAELSLSDCGRVLLFVGRFMQNKGIHVVRQIAAARPDVHWIMIGAGEIDPSQWKLTNAEVLPPQSQAMLRKYYLAADLFVLPSVGEGFPLTVQEALASGLPAAVSQETAAWLPDAPLIRLDVGDLAALLQTLDELLTDGTRLASLSAASTEYSRRWAWDQVAEEYEKIFVKVLGHRTPLPKEPAV